MSQPLMDEILKCLRFASKQSSGGWGWGRGWGRDGGGRGSGVGEVCGTCES
jgi:hypothetical protein